MKTAVKSQFGLLALVVSMAGHVNHDRAGQDQNVIFPLGDIDTIMVH